MKASLTFPLLLLAACGPAGDGRLPGDADDTRSYAGIGARETIRFTGREGSWGGEVSGGTLTYASRSGGEGARVAVERFAGRGGLSFSGEVGGEPLIMAITPGACSDGTGERTYPFTATLQIGQEQRNGCAWLEGGELDRASN